MLGLVERLRSDVHLFFDVYTRMAAENPAELKPLAEKYITDYQSTLQNLKTASEQMHQHLELHPKVRTQPDQEARAKITTQLQRKRTRSEKIAYVRSLSKKLEQHDFHDKVKRQKLLHEDSSPARTGITLTLVVNISEFGSNVLVESWRKR